MDDEAFVYEPLCTEPGCLRPAIFKVAAPWSDGTSRELKTYGLCCLDHRGTQLARARRQRVRLRLTEGEMVGEVGFYQLLPGVRDAELSRVPNDP